MKIIQISTYDIRGGAAIAAYRLNRGLRQIGQDCRMLVRHKESSDNSIHFVTPPKSDEQSDEQFLLEVPIQEHYIDSHRTDISNTIFSLPYPGYDLSNLPLVQSSDVLNLHWVARYQSLLTLNRLFSLNKPVVWTLHDQWAFTGGCHYGAGCGKYAADCMECPQLDDDPYNLPAAILRDKREFFKGADLTIVTPSRWMAECARESRLFKDLRVDVIPNSLETDLYTPLPKTEAKGKMGLGGDTVTLLFGGEDGNERRKGFKELVAVIQYCLKDGAFQGLLEDGKIRLICFGHPNDEIETLGIPVNPLGYLDSDEKIRDAYAGADIFILPSLEDNLPNTILEAMSCGTPVVAFETGGIPDMVASGITGQIVPLGDPVKMGEALLSLIFNPDKRKVMGKACRKKIEKEYALDVQAGAYLELYEELARNNKRSKVALSALNQEGSREAAPAGGQKEILSAPIEPGVGTQFNAIYGKVLFKALREFASYAHSKWQKAEADRDARLEVIGEQGDWVQKLESEVDRWLGQSKGQGERIVELESEVDRWLGQSKSQGERIVELESEVDRWLGESKRLQEQYLPVEAERNELRYYSEHLRKQLEVAEADRAARLEVIENQGERIVKLESEVDRWRGESRGLQKKYLEAKEVWHNAKEAWHNELRYYTERLAKQIEAEHAKLRYSGSPGVGRRLRAFALSLKRKERIQESSVSEVPQKAVGNPLVSFKREIDLFNNSQSNKGLLDSIRTFNHNMLDHLNDSFPLRGCMLLDIGASAHGYALERALEHGVTFYAGIGLDITKHEYVIGEENNAGILLNMNATSLKFPDAFFDAVLSISTFEHISDVSAALAEVDRVLKPGGWALISFEPIWSCSYGHHLHHFGSCSDLIPPWSHLIWPREQMQAFLSDKWPGNASLSLDQAIDWIYSGDSINRLNLREFKELFGNCPLTIVWMVDLKEEKKKLDPATIERSSDVTGLDPDELTTKGLSLLLSKEH